MDKAVQAQLSQPWDGPETWKIDSIPWEAGFASPYPQIQLGLIVETSSTALSIPRGGPHDADQMYDYYWLRHSLRCVPPDLATTAALPLIQGWLMQAIAVSVKQVNSPDAANRLALPYENMQPVINPGVAASAPSMNGNRDYLIPRGQDLGPKFGAFERAPGFDPVRDATHSYTPASQLMVSDMSTPTSAGFVFAFPADPQVSLSPQNLAMQHILTVKDDGHGLRSNADSDRTRARYAAFQIDYEVSMVLWFAGLSGQPLKAKTSHWYATRTPPLPESLCRTEAPARSI